MTELAGALIQYALPSLISAGANLIGKNLASNSSVSSAANSTNMNQSLSTQSGSEASSSSGASSTSTTQASTTSGTNEQTGNTAALGNLLSSALTGITGNNSQTAANFNQTSAQTANNLQTGLWTVGNALSMWSNAQARAASQQSQASAMAYNSEEAQKNRDWQEEMSNTSYQRAVKDLEAAGLNPVLAAYNGYGASTPSGGYGSVSGGQTYQQANIASSPSMHTASMQAMYDYGNNTAQFLQNAQTAINTAKQYGSYESASAMQNISDTVMTSSAKSVSNLSQALSSSGSSSSRNSQTTKGTTGLNIGSSSKNKAGGGAGRTK